MTDVTDEAPIRPADELTGWPRTRFRLLGLWIAVAVRMRAPVWMTLPAIRSVGPLLEDRTLVPAMAAIAPQDVRRTLDVRYGRSPAELLDVFRPFDAHGPLPVVVWVHGGGWIGGTKNDLRPYLAVLASHGFAVVGVDYTWAPEAHYPTQVVQASRAVEWVRSHAAALGIDPHRLILAGDSAGAHIAAQLARGLTDAGYAARAGLRLAPVPVPSIRGAVLTSGPFRLGPSKRDATMGAFGDLLLRAYTGHRDYLRVPMLRTASLVDDLDASFPPAFVSAGTTDPMLADSVALARALDGHGVPVEEAFFPADHDPELPHEFAVDLRRPEARDVLERIADFVRRRTAELPGASIDE
ncbi:alpha/beta hydrolase [Humibacter ginsenosidimutans]|uniref:Alpha/beta hydrolase n=1 Tax=Humibacter ginsenosidimutans TaxID=2599293 RepID=A0A5B8M5U9_9MICO|nr:alpha/beta hydrolase [Humibacter ginsenosidimutans]QDZ15324.1 alpha/beta hydrolase [Humibacter ginsenosidimutans]